MSDIDQMKLRRLDLTVMLVFLGLMRHRKAVTVANEMGLTQSSISHALKRLRDIFEDELFLRRPFGLEPTAVATALEPQIRTAVETLNAALGPRTPFDPATATGTLRLSAFDYELATLVPPLLAELEREAPQLTVSAIGLGRKAAIAALDEGDIDLALGFFWETSTTTICKPLFSDGYCLVARQGHPILKTPDLNAYLNADHLLVSPGGGTSGIADQTLADLGQTRHVRVTLPMFFPALPLLASSDLVATLPTRLARRFARNFGLASADLPFHIRPYTVSTLRHRRDAHNPRLDWIEGQLTALLSD